MLSNHFGADLNLVLIEKMGANISRTFSKHALKLLKFLIIDLLSVRNFFYNFGPFRFEKEQIVTYGFWIFQEFRDTKSIAIIIVL